MTVRHWILLFTGLLFGSLTLAKQNCANLMTSQNGTAAKKENVEEDWDNFKPEDFERVWKTIRKNLKGAQLVAKGSVSTQRAEILRLLQIEKQKIDLNQIPASRFEASRYQTENFLDHLPLGKGYEFLIHSNNRTGKVMIEFIQPELFSVHYIPNTFWESYMTQIVIDVKDGYWRRFQIFNWTPDMRKPITTNSYTLVNGDHSPIKRDYLKALETYYEMNYPSVNKEASDIQYLISINEVSIATGDGIPNDMSIKQLKDEVKKLKEQYAVAFEKSFPLRLL